MEQEGGGRVLGRGVDGGGGQKIRQEESLLGVDWIKMRVGDVREIKGGLTVSRVGEWGYFSVWLVASNLNKDSGAQGATVHGAKSILNPWYHTFAT